MSVRLTPKQAETVQSLLKRYDSQAVTFEPARAGRSVVVYFDDGPTYSVGGRGVANQIDN